MSIGDIFISGDTIATQTTNTDLNILPNGTGVISIPNGITFDGINVLKNFIDIISWISVLSFGGASIGITYSVQQGLYSRIGKIVFIEMQITLTSKGVSVGQAIITGVPLPVNFGGFLNARWESIILDANYFVVGAIANLSQIDLQECGNNNAFVNLTNANLTNVSSMFFSGCYLTT